MISQRCSKKKNLLKTDCFFTLQSVKAQSSTLWETSSASLDESFVIIRPCVVLVILVTFHLILNVGSIELLTSRSVILPDAAGPLRSRSTCLRGSTLVHDCFCCVFVETRCFCVKVLHEESSVFTWSKRLVRAHLHPI